MAARPHAHGLAACPLCGSADATTIDTVQFARIWSALEHDWGACLSKPVRAAHETPAGVTDLVRCSVCGLEWFRGAVPGSPQFYGELMSAVRYEAERWEFDLVCATLTASDRVVDLGCGSGTFLRRSAAVAGRAAGVDHHAPAVTALRTEGLEAHATTFGAFAARELAAFSVATAFHVIEHLSSVEEVSESATQLLEPGGRLYVAVPDRERALRRPLEALDLPPHHVSRWSHRQLRAIADGQKLRPTRVIHSPPAYSELAQAVDDALARRAPLVPPQARRVLRRGAVGRRRHRLLSQTGLYAAARLYGHTMLAEFERR